MNSSIDQNRSQTSREGTLAVALRLFRICGKGEAAPIALGLILLLAGSAAALLAPWPMKWVIDGVIGNRPVPAFLSNTAHALSPANSRVGLLVLLCAGQLLLHVIVGALSVASTYVLVAVGLRMVFKLRCEL